MYITLDKYVKMMNTKINLKEAAKKLGFESANGVLFRKDEGNEDDGETWNIKFDDDCIDIWFSKNPRRRTSQYYSAIRTEVDKGFYTEEKYIEWAIENLKNK